MQSRPRRLLLIRHAHAVGPGVAGGDRARELSARGLAAARELGVWLVNEGLELDALMVSSARRTVQTAERIAEAYDRAPPMDVREDLYLATPTGLGQAIASCSDDLWSLAVVAHNPGIWEFAARAADRSGRIIEGYSPATCTVFEYVGDWNEFCAATPRLVVQRSG